MANWKELVLDIIRLTDTVQRLNNMTEKLADQTNDIDKRVVRLETLVEVAKLKQISDTTADRQTAK